MKKVGHFINRFYLPIVLILAIVFFTIVTDTFFTAGNLINILVQNAYVVVATMGISMVMIAGGVDMSVSYEIGLISVVGGKMLMNSGVPVVLIIIIMIALGALLGFLNGFFTVSLKVHPFVATLATMTIYQGIAYVYSGAVNFYNFPDAFKAIGQKYLFGWLPICVLVMVGMFLIAFFMLRKTYFGRYIYAIGGNEEAARLAGINTRWIRIGGFMVASVFIAVATIILTARTATASAGIAADAVFTCISACVLGGISFTGGKGNVANMFLSVFILGVLSNGMQLMGLSTYSQYIMKGVVLLIAIAINNLQERNHQRELANQTKETHRAAEAA